MQVGAAGMPRLYLTMARLLVALDRHAAARMYLRSLLEPSQYEPNAPVFTEAAGPLQPAAEAVAEESAERLLRRAASFRRAGDNDAAKLAVGETVILLTLSLHPH